MKKPAIVLMVMMLLCLMTSAAWAADADKTAKEQAKITKAQTEIDELSTKALANLYAKIPAAEKVIQDCYAYATLSNTGMKLGWLGDAHGRGVAINKVTKEKVYMRMKEMGLGFGLGVKEYDLIFVISTEDAWKSFVSGKVKFATSADAAAKDGKKGGSVDGASIAGDGIWVYQITKKGLALEASIKGTKIYPDKKLNAPQKETEGGADVASEKELKETGK
ncbi:YSC84-related protein [Selenomonas ruminis]|uniref:Lipid-binding SYLF domain-containing protein n=1 Tax=Selenomonas ruminis TaxID=2593411 RepID=A0A5D6W9U1_9FIRM|nr:lipid-binding SYLF domain-containing protein [Selenomonas sp. mPRGC5]TYZ24590.1 lipid-binding SYLF domain-containing protein [Selenomonas sp. mPRGC5]